MRYISTRGGAEPACFDDVLIQALAPDGGLYLPETWPKPLDWSQFQNSSLAEIAAEVLTWFAGDQLPRDEALEITSAAFGGFMHPEITPLKKLGDQTLLELFHGPTLAFKDVALQIIARLFERHLKAHGGRLSVVVATSGDTGGAAVAALAGRDNLTITALHPKGRISEVQRRFMTTSDAANVLNLAVEGTFDDCQSIVKDMFADRPFAERVHLGGVNSINWARVAAQSAYYIYACLRIPERPVSFSVPTGNFGDVFAGYVAKQLGAPVGRLIVAVNENDILDRTIKTGRYEKRGVRPTRSPSMDIEVASNFERLLFEAGHRDAELVTRLMVELREGGSFVLPQSLHSEIRRAFSSYRAGEEQVCAVMARAAELGELIDPHTAIGLFAAERAAAEGEGGPIVTLATAHPAKFPDAVEEATGKRPQLPEGCAPLFDRDERYVSVPNDVEAVKNAIEGHLSALN